MRKTTTFVTGKKGRFQIQAPVEHPAWCLCEKCVSLPLEERATPHTYRIRRRSPFPDNRTETARYAREVVQKEEQRLRSLLDEPEALRPMTLAEIAALYFKENPRMVSAATIERDRINSRNLCRLVPIERLPDSIDEPVAVHYRNARLAEGARPRTVLNELSFLRGLLQFGLAWQSVTGMRGVRFLKVPDVGEWDSDGVALSRAEFRAVLGVVSDINRRRMIFGLTTMLRRTPLLALKQKWIDQERRWLSVPADMMKKGRARRRSPLEVPISDWALEQVRDLESNENGYLWATPATGKPLTRVHDIFADCVEESGVRPFSCHDLRTTGATWLRDAGVDELIIAILLGHRSTFDPVSASFHAPGANVTRQYTRIYEAALREAVAVFDRIRQEIDPVCDVDQNPVAYESEIESADVPPQLSYWNGGGYLVAHTGFEPVLPP